MMAARLLTDKTTIQLVAELEDWVILLLSFEPPKSYINLT